MNAPTQYEVKILLSDVVPHGVLKLVAENLEVSEGDVSRRFNPNDDRKCGIGEGLRELIALKNADRKAFEIIRAFVENVLDSEDREDVTEDSTYMMGDVAKELADVIYAQTHKAPEHVRRKESVEARAKLCSYERSLGQTGRLRKVG